MLRYIVSVVLLFSIVRGFSQTDTARVRPPRPPKVKKELKEFIPTGVRFGVDLYSFSRNLWDEPKNLTEFQLDVDFRHYLLVLEYGTSKIEEIEEGFSYTSNGSYFRIGPEVNVLYDPSSLHVVSLGLRYGSSIFDDQLIYKTVDAFGNTLIAVSNEKAKAQWAEFTLGTKAHLWKGLFMGFILRYKFLKKVQFNELEPHWLPGFGENRADDNNQFGFSYYLAWRFGIKKKVDKSVITIEK